MNFERCTISKEQIDQHFTDELEKVLRIIRENLPKNFSFIFNVDYYQKILSSSIDKYLKLNQSPSIEGFRKWLNANTGIESVDALFFQQKHLKSSLIRHIEKKENYISAITNITTKKQEKRTVFEKNLFKNIQSLISSQTQQPTCENKNEKSFAQLIEYNQALEAFLTSFFLVTNSQKTALPENAKQCILEAMIAVNSRLSLKKDDAAAKKYQLLKNIFDEFNKSTDPNTQMLCLELFIKTASSHRNLDENNTNRFFSAKSDTTSIKLFRKCLEGKLSRELNTFVNSQISGTRTQGLSPGN